MTVSTDGQVIVRLQLQAVREARGLKRGGAARVCGVNWLTWDHWEKGKSKPTWESLAGIIANLGLTDANELIEIRWIALGDEVPGTD